MKIKTDQLWHKMPKEKRRDFLRSLALALPRYKKDWGGQTISSLIELKFKQLPLDLREMLILASTEKNLVVSEYKKTKKDSFAANLKIMSFCPKK